MKKPLLSALAFALAAGPFASAVALAGPNTAQRGPIAPAPIMAPAPVRPIAPSVNAASRLQVARFARTVRARVNAAEVALQRDVARGLVRPAALREFASARANVDAALQRAISDGVILPREERRIEAMVAQLSTIDDAYRGRVRPHR